MSRRAIEDLVRSAALGSYGVIGFAGEGLRGRVAVSLGLTSPAIRVDLVDGISIDLDLVVAHGAPIAEVARQVDATVRYALRQALGREVERLTIHVDGLRVAAQQPPAGPEPRSRPDAGPRPDDLAASGTDVA